MKTRSGKLSDLSKTTRLSIKQMWEEAGPRIEDSKPKTKDGEQAVLDHKGKWIVLAPATTGKFKLGQRVRVTKDIPDFNLACATKPPIGMEGNIVLGRKYEKRFMVPKGKVAVRFSSKQLGYLDYNDSGKRFCYYYIPESVLQAVRKPKRNDFADVE
jgi:hypothetical protein